MLYMRFAYTVARLTAGAFNRAARGLCCATRLALRQARRSHMGLERESIASFISMTCLGCSCWQLQLRAPRNSQHITQGDVSEGREDFAPLPASQIRVLAIRVVIVHASPHRIVAWPLAPILLHFFLTMLAARSTRL